MNKYAVVFEAPAHPGDNWSSYVSDLSGCVSTGAFYDDCRAATAESIRLYVEDRTERGFPVPAPSARVEELATA